MIKRRKGSGGVARPSNASRLLRGALVLGAVALAYHGITTSRANVAFKPDPRQAHVLMPGNGVFTAAVADQIFKADPRTDVNAQSAKIARRALLQDATATSALGVLGFQAQLRGDMEASDRIFAYAAKLSRRDLSPQIWAIEEAVSRGDIVDALHHYNIALQTSGSAQGVLFPILAPALKEPKVRAALLDVMAEKPHWRGNFVGFITDSGLDPIAAMKFLDEGRDADLPINDEQRSNLVQALFARQEIDEAWSYYASFRSGAVRNISRDPRFTLNTPSPTPFDWSTVSEDGLSSVILNGTDGGVLDFFVPTGRTGILATQTQLLPPGRYVLRGQGTVVGEGENEGPFWTIRCQSGVELERLNLTLSSEPRQFAGSFVVPDGCPVQRLELIGRPARGIAGLSGQIHEVEIRPATRVPSAGPRPSASETRR